MSCCDKENKNNKCTLGWVKVMHWIALNLIIIGGLNWGMIGFFQLDVIAAIFGIMSPIARIIYALIGLSALWGCCYFFCLLCECGKKSSCKDDNSCDKDKGSGCCK